MGDSKNVVKNDGEWASFPRRVVFVSLKVVVVCLYSLVLSCIGYMLIVSFKADCLIQIWVQVNRVFHDGRGIWNLKDFQGSQKLWVNIS